MVDWGDRTKINESIFDHHKLSKGNAFIDSSWDRYATGYKESADRLVDAATEGHQQDFFVYPVMFLYRHYLELRLKEVLLALQFRFGQPRKIPNTHNLRALWLIVRPLMEQVWSDDGAIAMNESIADRIDEFHLVDRGSYSFRYPVSKDDLPSLMNVPDVAGEQMISLFQVREVIKEVARTLDGASYGIAYEVEIEAEMRAEHDAMQAEFEAEMRAEMQAEYEAEMRAEHDAMQAEFEAEMRAEMQAEYEAEMRAEHEA